jgi:hypothetical protein
MEENTGGYGDEGVLWHQHSNLLMRKILELWPDKNIPIADFGCGHNWYVSVFNYYGYTAYGFDMVDLGSKYFTTADITEPAFYQIKNPDGRVNILSLEVGEHIPAELADRYLNNLTAYDGDIILSWAVPGQDGIGHINCQPNEWVISKMNERGYYLEVRQTDELREMVKYCHCNWFKNTLMYFSKY